jgi:hypothetical protein
VDQWQDFAAPALTPRSSGTRRKRRAPELRRSPEEYMKPLFTVHAGEYLVGDYIEHNYPRWNVWIPSKDTGIDLLVTNTRNRKAVSLQVKFSKDYNPHHSPLLQSRMLSGGWWVHDVDKIKRSPADLWVFVLPSFIERETSYVILSPKELLRRFKAIHGSATKRIDSYLRVTKTKLCWESRGLPNADQDLIALDRYSDKNRNFTVFLNAWHQIEKRLT